MNKKRLRMRSKPGDSPQLVAMLTARRKYYATLEAEDDEKAAAEAQLTAARERRRAAWDEYAAAIGRLPR
jgi:hypothetical protein